jgi:hypothetical protein
VRTSSRRPAAAGPASVEQQPRPSSTERVLYGVLVLLGVLGLATPRQFNLAPADSILELTFLVTAALLARTLASGGRTLLVAGSLYLGLKTLLLMLYSTASIVDFLLAYKSFVYLVVLAFFVGKKVIDGPRLARFTTFMVAAFFVKYAYSVALGFADRPGVYFENNFELILLIGLVYLAYPYLARRDLVFAALVLTVLLSGSRSAALGLLCVYVFLYVRMSNRWWSLHLAGVAAVGYAVSSIFAARAAEQGTAQLDRVVFLKTFLYEVREWPLWEFLTGAPPLTALSPGSCGSLRFYELLFSKTDPGVCYSVIFHSYLMRAVFDHGLIGLVLIYGLLWFGLRRSGATVRDVLALLGLITLSALSVSAFNSVFAAILLAIAMGLDRSRPPPAPGSAAGSVAAALRRTGRARRPSGRGPGRRPGRRSAATGLRTPVAGAAVPAGATASVARGHRSGYRD